MTPLLSAPAHVMDVLRGDPGERPTARAEAALTLRTRLDEEARALLGAGPLEAPVMVSAATLRLDTPPENVSAPLAQIRGLLVNQALRLLSVGASGEGLMDDALDAWRHDVGTSELTRYLDQLDADERARLRTDVTAHCVTLRRSLGPLPSAWLPRTSLRAHQRLVGGDLILRDVIDLMVGTTASDAASVALLDLTTSPLGEGTERAIRYHALVQTLRTGVTPLRSAAFSTATGDLWCHDVNDELLERGVDDVLEVLRRRNLP